jgi:hypothetical protein
MRPADRVEITRIRPLERLPLSLSEPWIVLVPLVVAQWIAVLIFALTVRHNGWLFYQGGDETYYYTTSWLLSNLHLPATAIGYGWSYLLSPLGLVAGTNFLVALPAIILFQTIVLLPVSLLCVYGITARIGGRLLGYVAAGLWVFLPYLVIPLFVERYHQKYVELFLPQALGLTNLGDFPSMVFLLVSAYFVLRAVDDRSWTDAAMAGLAAGFAAGVKPANLLFLPAPILALAVARRWRQLLPFAAALAPALITLALWKHRGGQVAGVSAPAMRLASSQFAPPVLSIFSRAQSFVSVDWHRLHENFLGLREFFWSMRILEWLPIAGALALLRRSRAQAVLVVAWFAAFLIFKGSNGQSSVEDASFFRLLMPAFPAFFLLAVSIPVLAPTGGAWLRQRFAVDPPRPWSARRFYVAAGVLALIPLVLVLAVRPIRGPTAANYFEEGVFLPVDHGFTPSATGSGSTRQITWQPPSTGSTKPFYRVFRSPVTEPAPDPTLPPAQKGIRCLAHDLSPSVAQCQVQMQLLGTTSSTHWVDKPGRGRWVYRIGLGANWIDDPKLGDVLLLSDPVTVTVP